ncbi:Fic family protein [Candidatus Margulisiibacteriota bacterium]
MLSYRLDSKQTKALKDIHVAAQRHWDLINSFSDEKQQFIRNNSLISNIGASTRIENAVLTDVEIDWINTEIETSVHTDYKDKEKLIKNKLSKDKERSIEEVAGYRDAINIVINSYQDLIPLRESDIKGLHRELLKYYPEAKHHAGDYKSQINSVTETNDLTGRKKTILKTADPGVITAAGMADLVKWFNETVQNETWVMSVAVELVFRFLAIHPFQDGNGRLSRLLFQLVLMNSEDEYLAGVIPYIALDRNIEQTRAEYYLVLRKCSGGIFHSDPKKYKYGYLLNYMLNMFAKSMANIVHYAEKYDRCKALTETDLKVLGCFKEEPERNLQTKELVESLSIPRRTAIYSLNKLVKGQFLQTTGKGPSLKYKLTF